MAVVGSKRGGAAALVVVVLLLAAGGVRGDELEVLSWRGKKPVEVLMARQELDLTYGFDSFFLEVFAAPKNERRKRTDLAERARRQWQPLGQFEAYMAAVAKARDQVLAQFDKSGFKPVCTLARPKQADQAEVTFRAGKRKVTLALVRHGEKDEVVMRTDQGGEYRMMRFKEPVHGRDGTWVGGRFWRQVALLRDGRMLAVVIRRMPFPQPENVPGDELYFYPLRRACKQLGLPYPLTVEACGAEESSQ